MKDRVCAILLGLLAACSAGDQDWVAEVDEVRIPFATLRRIVEPHFEQEPEAPREDILSEELHRLVSDQVALNRAQLKEHRFLLAGHTDDQGDTEYNLDLSLRRAEAARQYLISEYGVEAERLEASGLGSAEPRSTDGTPEARRMNRRVVLEMLPQ